MLLNLRIQPSPHGLRTCRPILMLLYFYLLPDPSKFVKMTQTKAVYGICIDPQDEERGVASFIENQVYIWDIRYFEKALHTLPLQKSSIVKVNRPERANG